MTTMTVDHKAIARSNYFVDKLKEQLDPKREVELGDYVNTGGLLELTRQYATMPQGVKALSEQGLRDSIIGLIDKHGTLLAFRESIPIKEFRKPLLQMFLVSKLQSEKYIVELF